MCDAVHSAMWNDRIHAAITYFSRIRNPVFIPSVFSSPDELLLDHAQGRVRTMEARAVSIAVHAAVLSLAFLAVPRINRGLPHDENAVFLNSPMTLPFFEGESQTGGGGGGGGNHEQGPWATGQLPHATRIQLLSPEPQRPTPMKSAEELLAILPSIQAPIDIPQEHSLPIGDPIALPNASLSSGPGSDGGIGSGRRQGIGSGDGPGYGPGKNGGMGGGPDGGIGNQGGIGIYPAGTAGLKRPVPLAQPQPFYTEDARRSRIEGRLILQAIVRKNGEVDVVRVVRGLGFGLDESAIKTITSSWRFTPGTLNGVPVDVQANIQVDFRMY